MKRLTIATCLLTVGAAAALVALTPACSGAIKMDLTSRAPTSNAAGSTPASKGSLRNVPTARPSAGTRARATSSCAATTGRSPSVPLRSAATDCEGCRPEIAGCAAGGSGGSAGNGGSTGGAAGRPAAARAGRAGRPTAARAGGLVLAARSARTALDALRRARARGSAKLRHDRRSRRRRTLCPRMSTVGGYRMRCGRCGGRWPARGRERADHPRWSSIGRGQP